MTDLDELLDTLDATGLAAAIRTGEVSAPEVVEAAIARAEERDPTLNAFVGRRFDEARDEAARVDAGAPFAGVPFVVKDLGMQVAGLPHTRGSRLFADDVSDRDSELVARYRRAGFVVLGTTNTPELGKNASTEPVLHGPTRNPHELDHSPGGSSGGTAAAIAAGIVSIGHGNDGGGSIRIPSSACGLFGLKPSRGRTPSHPARTLMAAPLGINHVLTRSVRDSAAVLDATAGPHVGDAYEIDRPGRPWIEALDPALPAQRVAVSSERFDGQAFHPDCRAATEAMADTLSSLGHHVEEAAPAVPADAILTVLGNLMGAPLAVTVDQRLAELGRELRDDDLEPFTRLLYDTAAATPATKVIEAYQLIEELAHGMGVFHADFDLLLTPTMAEPVPPLGHLDMTDIDAMIGRAANYSAMTALCNATGQPAVSIPGATDSDGLPVGVQLIAAFGREDLLLAISAQVEDAAPWPTSPVWPPRGRPS